MISPRRGELPPRTALTKPTFTLHTLTGKGPGRVLAGGRCYGSVTQITVDCTCHRTQSYKVFLLRNNQEEQHADMLTAMDNGLHET